MVQDVPAIFEGTQLKSMRRLEVDSEKTNLTRLHSQSTRGRRTKQQPVLVSCAGAEKYRQN